jgi:short coiled-coil protein
MSSSIPNITEPSPPHDHPSNSSSSSSSFNEDKNMPQKLRRPKMTSRKSSGTIIIPRESAKVELNKSDETFDEDDARAMSPRRSSQDLEKMGQDARAQLNEFVLPYDVQKCFATNKRKK